ncbi:hypothetical protein PUNSTDRAFT_60514, partial [Punctularia strigosozonata HHB-11173 SS5]|uniref:uncharacterized protein n=1 Tax=Punctularia strigosozonata (strain HHB-11173) TaxID=741275 RepID=UPI0004417CD9
GTFWIDLCMPFGLASFPGIWGRVADCMATVHSVYGVAAIKKWVDNFAFLCLPSGMT